MAETQQEKQAQEGTLETSDFASLLQKQFKPQTETAKSEVESAVRTLAQHALEKSSVVGSDAVESINAISAEIDKRRSEQINQIVDHPDNKALEGTGRRL